jgi:hypothetical protein
LKRRLLTSLATVFAGLMMMVGTASANSSEPTANGSVGYDAYGLARHANFDVESESNRCTAWNVNGTYTINFMQTGDPTTYTHDATISNQKANGNYTISGGYPAGGPHTFAWAGTGKVSGSTVTNSVDYTVGAPGTHMDMTGTIASNGSMSGTWTDNYGGGNRTGTWSTASGTATPAFAGCRGEGTFRYSDANNASYRANIRYVKVSGADAWFAGRVTRASNPSWVGNWVFVKVHDGGSSGDQIWGSFTDQTTAKMGVAAMTNPTDGPFAVTSGNLVVHP